MKKSNLPGCILAFCIACIALMAVVAVISLFGTSIRRLYATELTEDLATLEKMSHGHISRYGVRDGEIWVTVIDRQGYDHLHHLKHNGLSQGEALERVAQKKAQLRKASGWWRTWKSDLLVGLVILYIAVCVFAGLRALFPSSPPSSGVADS